MADDFKIKIVTEGDPRGAQKVADTLGKVTRAANDNTKAAAQTSRGMNELGEASEKGAAVGRVLNEVLRGNFGAISQLGVALKASGAAVKTSVFGVVLIAATALMNFLPGLITRIRGTKSELEGTADKADAVAQAFANIGKARGSALSAELAAIQQEAKGAANELQRVLSLQKLIADAKGGESVEDKRRREDVELGGAYSGALETRNRTAGEASRIGTEVFQLEQTLAGPLRDAEERAAMERELATLGPVRPDNSTAGVQRNLRIMELSGRVNSAQVSPETEKFISEQKKLLDALRPLAEQAGKAAAEAEEALRSIGRGVVGLRPDGSAIPDSAVMLARGIEDRRRREAAGVAEPVSQGGSSSAIVDGRPMEMSIKGNDGVEIGHRIAAAVEARIKAGEENTARIVENRMKQMEQQLKSQRTK